MTRDNKGYFKDRNGKYVVRIYENGQRKCLGSYNTEKEATEVYSLACKEKLKSSVELFNHTLNEGIIYEDNYVVFSNGDIFSITGYKISPTLNIHGYHKCHINDRTMSVHRIVAQCFIPNPENKPCVNHINGIKTDNRVENLEWCTYSENNKHAYDNKLMKKRTGELNSMSKLTLEDVNYIRESYIPKDSNYGIKALSEKFKVHKNTIDDIVHNKTWIISNEETEEITVQQEQQKKKKQPFLYPHQKQAISKMFTGCILNGSTGSGKSRAGIAYYFQKYGGYIDDDHNYTPMRHKPKPPDLYIITVAKKRDDKEFEGELAPFLLSTDPKQNMFYGNKVVVDSWQNIKKYADVTGAFFIFDEDKVTGKGIWAKSFLKIAKNNEWIILSATAGDRWEDFETVFIANGFFKNRTEMAREHYIYARYAKFPKIERYYNEGRLFRLRDKILIDMEFKRHTVQNHEDVYTQYDMQKYRDAIRTRWNPYDNEPIEQPSTLCYVLRRIVNEDESRQAALLELLEDHPRVIIFYNFNYELDILLNLAYQEGTEVAQYNGSRHEPVPKSERWVYLCQYNAAEAWNNTTTNCVIFYSQNYSYKTMIQAAGRVDRLTSPYSDLYYYHLKSRSGIDLAISKALKNKKKFNERKWTKWDK